jgi:hypothetical protein
MALRLHEHVIETAVGTKTVLVSMPSVHVRAGRDKLAELRSTLVTSTLDMEIVEHVRAHPPGTFSAFVFCGCSDDGTGSWRFADELDEDERFEMGYMMWRSQLPLNRFCAAAGILDNLYVEWTHLELEAFSAGASRIAWELRNEHELYPEPDTADARLARLHVFLVERQTFLLSMPLGTILTRILPHRFNRLERRRTESIGPLLEGLPPRALNGYDAVMPWEDARRAP